MRIAALALAAALAACSPKAEKAPEAPPAPAAAATTVKPGQWRTTVTILDVSAAGMPAGALAQMKARGPMVTTTCTTSDDLKEFTQKGTTPSSACTITRMETNGGRIDGETTCTADGMTQTMKMTGTHAPDRVDMTMDMSMQTPAGPMTQKMQMLSERIGDCPG